MHRDASVGGDLCECHSLLLRSRRRFVGERDRHEHKAIYRRSPLTKHNNRSQLQYTQGQHPDRQR